MKTLRSFFAKKCDDCPDLVHLGLENWIGNIVYVASIHDAAFMDLLDVEAYKLLQKGKTLRICVDGIEEWNG